MDNSTKTRNTKTITLNELGSISESNSMKTSRNADYIANKPKLILQAYNLYNHYVGTILEKIDNHTYIYFKFANGEKPFHDYCVYDKWCSPYYTGHMLPVYYLSSNVFSNLMVESEDFEIFNNAYGTPSIVLGKYPNGVPIVMPILNWENLPKNINPFSKDTNPDPFLELGLPPQLFHELKLTNNNSFCFSPKTDTESTSREEFMNMVKNNSLFSTPIEYSIRQYKPSPNERIIKLAKVNETYNSYKVRQSETQKLLALISELSKADEQLAKSIKDNNFRTSSRLAELEIIKKAYERKEKERAEKELSDEFHYYHFGMGSARDKVLDLSEEASIHHSWERR
ncbi:MAG: hypothetical protein E7356_04160 [Clostridiales bacterium]|nr:hypothetical protein [Clostridiales bacterium]